MFPYLVTERGPNSNAPKLLEDDEMNLSASRESLPNWANSLRQVNTSPQRRKEICHCFTIFIIKNFSFFFQAI